MLIMTVCNEDPQDTLSAEGELSEDIDTQPQKPSLLKVFRGAAENLIVGLGFSVPISGGAIATTLTNIEKGLTLTVATLLITVPLGIKFMRDDTEVSNLKNLCFLSGVFAGLMMYPYGLSKVDTLHRLSDDCSVDSTSSEIVEGKHIIRLREECDALSIRTLSL